MGLQEAPLEIKENGSPVVKELKKLSLYKAETKISPGSGRGNQRTIPAFPGEWHSCRGLPQDKMGTSLEELVSESVLQGLEGR